MSGRIDQQSGKKLIPGCIIWVNIRLQLRKKLCRGREMKTVLLTDDNPDIVELVQLILANSGYNLVVASDGVEAVDTCLTQTPDLVLMDLKMPNMDGLAATQSLRDKGFSNPIVILTASESADDRLEAERAGCDGYIVKTLEMKEVESTLDKFLHAGGEKL